MATLGTQILTPESGWQRIDNLDSSITYNGTGWTTNGNSSGIFTNYYNAGVAYNTSTSASTTITFAFSGTKLRLYGVGNASLSTSNLVTIDGTNYSMANWNQLTNNQGYGLTFEKTNLSNSVHYATISYNGSTRMYFDCLDIDSNGSMLAIQISTPQTGWQRIDNTSPYVSYKGSGWTIDSTASGAWTGFSGTGIASNATTSADTTIRFSFVGTKLRLYGVGYAGMNTSNVVNIDGTDYSMLQWSYLTSNVGCCLMFHITNLTNATHVVTIKYNSSTRMYLDCVDVDSTATILHPVGLTLKTSVASMNIGEAIACEYTATANAVGSFFNLGAVTKSEILPASTTTPNGTFYFIKVAKGTLIADRNVQTGVSWDVLNAGKLIQGKIFDLTDALATTAFSASSSYSAAYSADKAFNNLYDESNGGWQTPVGNVTNQWLKVDFGTSFPISYVRFQTDASTSYPGVSVKNFRIEASSDNTNWVVQYRGLGVPGAGAYTTATFTPTGSFRYWRLYMIDNYGHASYIMVSEVEMSIISSASFIRSITGGTSYLEEGGNRSSLNRGLGNFPAHNDWDSYIVSSTLGGKITAGDNNVWNWSTGDTNNASWTTNTSHSSIGASTTRVNRGFGRARSFNGTSDYVSFTSTIVPVGAKTISFSIKMATVGSAHQRILSNLGAGNKAFDVVVIGTSISAYAGTIRFGFYNGTTWNYIVSSNIRIDDNVWHAIKYVWDGTTANPPKIYVDNVDVTTYPTSTSFTEVALTTTNLVMGKNAGSSTEFFAGSLTEITILNALGIPVLYLPMLDSSTTLTDQSGNGYNGTATGTTVVDKAKIQSSGFPTSSGTTVGYSGFRPVLKYTE